MEQDLIKVAQNLAQVPEDRRPIETINFNHSRALNALKDKMIVDCTEEEVKEKLLLIYSMIGLRHTHYPQGQEKNDIHDYIFLKYGRKTLSEFVLAFDLAINNELDLQRDEIRVYDQFTISYLAQIMSAYKKWLYQQSSQVKKDYPKMIEERVILTDEEKAEWIMDWKVMPVINLELIPIIFFDFLSQKNIINVTPKQKWAYIEKATTQIKSKLFEDISECKTNDAYIAFNKFENMEKTGFDGEFKGRILNRAKRLITYDYLTDNL